MKTPRQIIADELAGIYDDIDAHVFDYHAGKILDALYEEGYREAIRSGRVTIGPKE